MLGLAPKFLLATDGAPRDGWEQRRFYNYDVPANAKRVVSASAFRKGDAWTVVASDVDDDGAVDLFVGGRVEPGRYGTSPQSRLLRNDGLDGVPVFTTSARHGEGIAPLPQLAEICRAHDAVLVVDDSHATGVLGATGRGTAEHFGPAGGLVAMSPSSSTNVWWPGPLTYSVGSHPVIMVARFEPNRQPLDLYQSQT